MSSVAALVLTAITSAVNVSRAWLMAIMAVSLAALVAGGLCGTHLYPLTDIPVLCIAIAGGLLIAGVLPARRAPILVLLIVLALLDAAQIVLPNQMAVSPGMGTTAHPAWYYYTMLVIETPTWHWALGVADVLLIAMICGHAKHRMLPRWAAAAPGVVGLGFADLLVALHIATSLPIVPFLLGGWLSTELTMIRVGHCRNADATSQAQD